MRCGFEKLSDEVRRVLVLAKQEAQHLQHAYIGTEHLLLGLLRLSDTGAVQVRTRLGVEPQAVGYAVGYATPRDPRLVLGDIVLVPEAERAIELANEERRHLGDERVYTEHVLLALLREGKTAVILDHVGVTLDRARYEATKISRERRWADVGWSASVTRSRSLWEYAAMQVDHHDKGMALRTIVGGPELATARVEDALKALKGQRW